MRDLWHSTPVVAPALRFAQQWRILSLLLLAATLLAACGRPAPVALRFNPQTGAPEAFLFEEYVREFPFDWTPKAPPLPGSGGRLSDEELVGATGSIVSSPMTTKDKAAAIRQLASR